LCADDEVMLASDGLYEQPDGSSQLLRKSLVARTHKHLSAGKSLHRAILHTLTEVLGACQQRDDITVVTLSFRNPAVAVHQGGQNG
jgi:serine phosphatase RsbU (regulator of sigma subunit)